MAGTQDHWNTLHSNFEEWNRHASSYDSSSDFNVLSRVRRQAGDQPDPPSEIPAYVEDVVPTVVVTALTFIGVFLVLPILLLAAYIMGKRPARLDRRVHPSGDYEDDFEVITEKTVSTQISLEDGDDIMKDVAKGDIPFSVRYVADPTAPHEGFHLDLLQSPAHIKPATTKVPSLLMNTNPEDVKLSPDELRTKGMQTDPRSKNKKYKPPGNVGARNAVSNIEIFTPKNNKVNPFKPLVSTSDTAVVRKRRLRNHYDDKDKAVQTLQTAKKSVVEFGKPLTSTKPTTDTRTKTQPPATEECELCPEFNPSIRLADLTWLQLFQYMQADGGWGCRDGNDSQPGPSTRTAAATSTNPPIRELYKSKVNTRTEELRSSKRSSKQGKPKEGSLSKKHQHKKKDKE